MSHAFQWYLKVAVVLHKSCKDVACISMVLESCGDVALSCISVKVMLHDCCQNDISVENRLKKR